MGQERRDGRSGGERLELVSESTCNGYWKGNSSRAIISRVSENTCSGYWKGNSSRGLEWTYLPSTLKGVQEYI